MDNPAPDSNTSTLSGTALAPLSLPPTPRRRGSRATGMINTNKREVYYDPELDIYFCPLKSNETASHLAYTLNRYFIKLQTDKPEIPKEHCLFAHEKNGKPANGQKPGAVILSFNQNPQQPIKKANESQLVEALKAYGFTQPDSFQECSCGLSADDIKGGFRPHRNKSSKNNQNKGKVQSKPREKRQNDDELTSSYNPHLLGGTNFFGVADADASATTTNNGKRKKKMPVPATQQTLTNQSSYSLVQQQLFPSNPYEEPFPDDTYQQQFFGNTNPQTRDGYCMTPRDSMQPYPLTTQTGTNAAASFLPQSTVSAEVSPYLETAPVNNITLDLDTTSLADAASAADAAAAAAAFHYTFNDDDFLALAPQTPTHPISSDNSNVNNNVNWLSLNGPLIDAVLNAPYDFNNVEPHSRQLDLQNTPPLPYSYHSTPADSAAPPSAPINPRPLYTSAYFKPAPRPTAASSAQTQQDYSGASISRSPTTVMRN